MLENKWLKQALTIGDQITPCYTYDLTQSLPPDIEFSGMAFYDQVPCWLLLVIQARAAYSMAQPLPLQRGLGASFNVLFSFILSRSCPYSPTHRATVPLTLIPYQRLDSDPEARASHSATTRFLNTKLYRLMMDDVILCVLIFLVLINYDQEGSWRLKADGQKLSA